LTSDFRYIVSTGVLIDKINRYYDLVNPPMNFAQRRNYILYRTLPRESYLDMITFLQVEDFSKKIRLSNINNSDVVTETQIKVIMKDFGIQNLSDLVLDTAFAGYDKLKRRTYNAMQTLTIIITVHSVAAEKRRTDNTFKQKGLKKNELLYRPYPIGNRRLKDSVLV